jgi:hypothetical protein
LAGALLQTFGGWFRCILAFSRLLGLFPIYIGQMLAAIGGVFIVGSTPMLATVWFGPQERIIATSIGFSMNTIGMACASAITPEITKGKIL